MEMHGQQNIKKCVIEGKAERIGVTGRQERRRKQLLYEFKKREVPVN